MLAGHTIFNAHALASRLKDEYAIGAVAGCLLWRSFVNDVYRLEAGGRAWWLRVHPCGWRAPAQTRGEVDALLALADAGAAVAKPVARTNGEYLLGIEAPEGVRTAVLFAHAPGSEVSYGGQAGLANAARYGRAVACLHDVCDTLAQRPCHARIDLDYTVLAPAATVAGQLGESDRADLRRISTRLAALLRRRELTSAFCHGDLNGSNIHFDGDAARAIDFDCCGWGWRAFELAAFARGVTWSGGPGETGRALIDAYFEGYRSRRVLPDDDLLAQPAMLLAQRLWVTALHLDMAWRAGACHFGRGYAERFMAWLRDWETTL